MTILKKIIAGINLIYNCAKFQHDCAIFDSKLQQTNTQKTRDAFPFTAFASVANISFRKKQLNHKTMTISSKYIIMMLVQYNHN